MYPFVLSEQLCLDIDAFPNNPGRRIGAPVVSSHLEGTHCSSAARPLHYLMEE